MVVGASGSGKSTIVTHLCDGGWRFISDDVAPIQMPAMKVIPFIQAPSRRIFPGTVIDSSELGSVDREEVAWLDRQLAEAPCPIGAVVFPEFDLSSAAGLSRMSPGDGALGLLKYVRNFGDHLQHAVEQAALLARQVPMFRLCYNSGETAAAEIIDLL
jgi:hypothetical protein